MPHLNAPMPRINPQVAGHADCLARYSVEDGEEQRICARCGDAHPFAIFIPTLKRTIGHVGPVSLLLVQRVSLVEFASMPLRRDGLDTAKQAFHWLSGGHLRRLPIGYRQSDVL